MIWPDAYHGAVFMLPLESAMLRALPAVSLLAACTPSPQKVAMPSPNPIPSSSKPSPLTDSPAEALGRRILSTAFVRVGAGGHLTVELHDGSTVMLRDVVMHPKDYCGVQVAGAKYCGGYAEVAAARAGGPLP